jgi:hypothetical protein
MSYILPPNIFPPKATPYDSRTVSDSTLIMIAKAKGAYATDAPAPRESVSLYSKPFITITPQEAESARETPLTYPQTKAIKALTPADINMVSDYVKQP